MKIQIKPNETIPNQTYSKQIRIFGQKTFLVKKKLWKKIFVKKNWMKNIFVQKTFCSKLSFDPKFKVQKVFGTKNVWFNKIGCKKILTQNNFRFKKIWVQINFGSKKNWVQKNFWAGKVWSKLVQ